MPHLATFRAAGFSIWPFHEAQTLLVIEIYPRLLTGSVTKSDFDERVEYLDQRWPEIAAALACKAASSEDAFDAAVSAVVMNRHLDEISTLTASRDPLELIEGSIWWPREVRKAAVSPPLGANSQGKCPFCDIPMESVVAESRHAVAIRDRYPVSHGHTLVIPKAHAETLFAQSAVVQAAIWRLVATVRDDLQSEFNPVGFNVGLNDGRAAGQTVEHAHVHIIPRRDGDVADPRGGIRWVLLEPGVAYCFRAFYLMVSDMIEGAWSHFVQRRNPRLLGQVVDLRSFLFGTRRTSLETYRPLLRDLQQGRCFYCERDIRSGGDVDHFIPWRRYALELGHNFVLAHQGCNSSKSDLLAAEEHLERWTERNRTCRGELEVGFDERKVLHDWPATRQIARWAYGQVHQAGGQVWVQAKELRPLSDDWRRILSAASQPAA